MSRVLHASTTQRGNHLWLTFNNNSPTLNLNLLLYELNTVSWFYIITYILSTKLLINYYFLLNFVFCFYMASCCFISKCYMTGCYMAKYARCLAPRQKRTIARAGWDIRSAYTLTLIFCLKYAIILINYERNHN